MRLLSLSTSTLGEPAGGSRFKQLAGLLAAAFFLSALASALIVASGKASPRPWPDTTRGIHVFNDQLTPGLSSAQIRFAATHYSGTQKVVRSFADQLRAVNRNLLILHYRLGHAIGYRGVGAGCQPSGGYVAVVEGNEWIKEWPGDGAVQSSWFFPWSGSERVLNCDWGWYLADPDSAGWRNWWHGEVLRQLQANDNDGVFMDSLSVPNYLGAESYNPNLPAVNESFESAWSRRIQDWLAWLQTQPVGNYYLVPNVGSWITSREATDYSTADGVMVEGFALEADASPYNLEDWQLQSNRILDLTSKGKAIIGQNYVTGAQERMFTLGTYLLLKGCRSFINIDMGEDPEWWPEYDIPIGAPQRDAGANIANLYDDSAGVYRRRFSNGEVLVNPTSPWDGTRRTVTVNLDRTYYLARTSGGGIVPDSGETPGSVTYAAVESVSLGPYSAAVILDSRPSGSEPAHGDPGGAGPSDADPAAAPGETDCEGPRVTVRATKTTIRHLKRTRKIRLRVKSNEAATVRVKVSMATSRRGKRGRYRVVGKKRLTFTGAQTRRATLRLTRRGLKILRRRPYRRIRIVARARDLAGNRSTRIASLRMSGSLHNLSSAFLAVSQWRP